MLYAAAISAAHPDTPPLAEDQEEIESQRQTELDPGRLGRALRHPPVGGGLLRSRRRRHGRGQHPVQRQPRPGESAPTSSRACAARPADAGAAAVREHPRLPDPPDQRELRPRHHQPRLPGQLSRRLPDQGQPAAAGHRGDHHASARATTTAWRRAARPS